MKRKGGGGNKKITTYFSAFKSCVTTDLNEGEGEDDSAARAESESVEDGASAALSGARTSPGARRSVSAVVVGSSDSESDPDSPPTPDARSGPTPLAPKRRHESTPADDNAMDMDAEAERDTSMGDESTILEQHVPPSFFKFPKDSEGRSCQHGWFTKAPWLHYVKDKNHVLCFTCMHARRLGKLATNRGNEEAFVTHGVSKWKKAFEKINQHEQSVYHRDSAAFVVNALARDSVAKQLDAQLGKEQQKQASVALKQIIIAIRFICRSGLSLRGHGDDEGNFMTLLEENSLSCPELSEWLKRRDKWLSNNIQNEIVEIMVHMVQRKLREKIKKSKYFALMADGTTDVAGEEQFCTAVRIVNEITLETEEIFMGLYSTDSGTAATMHKICKDVLLRYCLSTDDLRGHCFDGAAAMSGRLNGLQKLLNDDQPKSLFVHCSNHSLDLAIQEVCKQSELISNSLSLVREVSKAILESAKRKAIYDQVVIEPDAENVFTKRLLSLCPTRWCVRAKSMRRFLENYARVKETLTLILHDSTCKFTDTRRATLRGYETKMGQFQTLLALKIALSVCEPAEQLAKGLQSKAYTATGAMQSAKALWRTYDSMGAADYDRLWDESERMNEQYNLELKMPEATAPRTRNPPHRLGQAGGRAAPTHLEPKDEVRRKYVSILDWVKNELDRRFDQPGMKQLANLETLLLDNTVDVLSVESLEKRLGVHSTDFNVPNLAAQLRISRTVMSSSVETVKEYAELFRELPMVSRKMLSEVERLVFLLLTVPATSCTCERSFSTLRYLKNYLRSTMKQARLTHLMLLYIHKGLAFEIDLDDVIKEFVNRTPERRNTFGKR